MTTTHRYSKVRILLAAVFFVLGFQLFEVGYSLKGFNAGMLPYAERAFHKRTSEFEATYQARGLNKGVDVKEFEQQLDMWKTETADYIKSISSGTFFFMENAAVLLSYLLCALFWINTYLVLRKSMQFDIMMKVALNAVWIYSGLLLINSLYTPVFVYKTTVRVIPLIGMLQGNQSTPAIQFGNMFIKTFFAPELIFLYSSWLLLFWGIPFVLYIWLKKRERLLLIHASS